MAGRKLNKDSTTYYLIQNKSDGAGIKFNTYNDVLEHLKNHNINRDICKLVKCTDLPFPNNIQYKDIDNKEGSIKNIVSFLAYELTKRKINLEHNIEIEGDVKNAICNMPDMVSFYENIREFNMNMDKCTKTVGEYYFCHFILPTFLLESVKNNKVRLFAVSADMLSVSYMFVIDCMNIDNKNFKCIDNQYLTIYISNEKMIIGTLYNTFKPYAQHNIELKFMNTQDLNRFSSYVKNVLCGI